jgi:hypothetical protein
MLDEPKFELRAQDKFMPEVLEFWARLVDAEASARPSSDKSREKAKKARALAHNVRAWQILNHSKLPD